MIDKYFWLTFGLFIKAFLKRWTNFGFLPRFFTPFWLNTPYLPSKLEPWSWVAQDREFLGLNTVFRDRRVANLFGGGF